jgi:hypothetical protein
MYYVPYKHSVCTLSAVTLVLQFLYFYSLHLYRNLRNENLIIIHPLWNLYRYQLIHKMYSTIRTHAVSSKG